MTLTEIASPPHGLGGAPSSVPDAQLWMLETGPLPPSPTHTSALVSPGFPSCGCKWGILTQGPRLPWLHASLLLPALRTPATSPTCAGRPWSLCSHLARWASAARKLPDLSCPGARWGPRHHPCASAQTPLLSVRPVDSCTAPH